MENKDDSSLFPGFTSQTLTVRIVVPTCRVPTICGPMSQVLCGPPSFGVQYKDEFDPESFVKELNALLVKRGLMGNVKKG